MPAGGFTVDLGDQEVAGSLRSHTEDAPLDDHPQDSRTRPTRRRRRTCFVAIPALLIRLPLTPDCRTMSEARAAGKAGPPARSEAAPAARHKQGRRCGRSPGQAGCYRNRAELRPSGLAYVPAPLLPGGRTTGVWPAVVLPQVRVFLPQPAGGHPVEAVDQPGDGHGGREVHQQVDMAGFPIALGQFRAEVRAHVPHYLLRPLQVSGTEDLVPVFGGEHQVGVQDEDTMPASADVLY